MGIALQLLSRQRTRRGQVRQRIFSCINSGVPQCGLSGHCVWRFSDATFTRRREAQTDRDVHAIDPRPLSNKLLAELPLPDFQLLVSHFTTVPLAQGNLLARQATKSIKSISRYPG